LVGASVKSLSGGICKVKTNIPMKIEGLKVESQKTTNGYVVEFKTSKGKTYRFSPVNK
jgi:alpha-L-fucosidase 2